MAKTKAKQPPMVQMYDYSAVKEYYKIFNGFLFSSEEIVRTEVLENKLILQIDTEKIPDIILLNGKKLANLIN